MTAAQDRWICVACQHTGARFSRRCAACGAKNTLCEHEPRPQVAKGEGETLGPSLVRASSEPERPPSRVKTGIAAWDELLGNGAGALGVVVPSSVLVVGGPGVGKTTQAACVASHVAGRLGGDALFVSAEMPRELAIATAKRGGAKLDRLVVLVSSDGAEIFDVIGRTRPRVVLYDSLQRISWHGRSGNEHALRAILVRALDIGQRLSLVSFLVSQVNADGRPAGPNFLAHDPDTVLYLEPGRLRTGQKHRHGVAGREVLTVGAEPTTPTPRAGGLH